MIKWLICMWRIYRILQKLPFYRRIKFLDELRPALSSDAWFLITSKDVDRALDWLKKEVT